MATAKRDLTNPPVQGPHERLLVPAEAAEFLRVSLDQLYHLTSAKKVPFLKVGGQLRFEVTTLLEHLRTASAERPSVTRGPRSERAIRLDYDRFSFPTPKRNR